MFGINIPADIVITQFVNQNMNTYYYFSWKEIDEYGGLGKT